MTTKKNQSKLQTVLESLNKTLKISKYSNETYLSTTTQCVIDSMSLAFDIFEKAKELNIDINEIKDELKSARYKKTNFGYEIFWPKLE